MSKAPDLRVYDDYIENTPQHKKKKESNTSKANKKSNHRHKYRDVLVRSYYDFVNGKKEHLSLGKQCEICGKTVLKNYFITKQTEDGRTRLVLNADEVRELHSDLEIVDSGETV